MGLLGRRGGSVAVSDDAEQELWDVLVQTLPYIPELLEKSAATDHTMCVCIDIT